MNQINNEVEEEEEVKEQNNHIMPISIKQNNSLLDPQINSTNQQEQTQQNEISFNGFKIYYNDPQEVVHIIQQNKQQEETQNYQNKLENSSNQIIEIVCKICFEGEEVVQEKGELLQPCLCSGSCQYIHEQCLKTWIVSRGQNIFEAKCEICNHNYEISHSKQKKLNIRLSFNQNQTGSILTVILTVLFFLTFAVFILFIVDIVLTIASESNTIIKQDQTLKFVALFIIFVFTIGFFIGMIQSFRENCIYEHIINWQIFNFIKKQQNEGEQKEEQPGGGINENNSNLQHQINMINRQQEHPVQISQINNVDNSTYLRQETYSNFANQMNGIQMTHQNISHIQEHPQERDNQQQMDSDQISQLINQLRSKQISPNDYGQQNSAERMKMLELFGYQANPQNNQNFQNEAQINQISQNKQQVEFQPQQIFIGKKSYLNQPLSQLNESTLEANPQNINKTIDKNQIQNSKQSSRMENRLDIFVENQRFKSKSTNIITINKIDNVINYREKNNKSQLSIQQQDHNQKAFTHYQYVQQGSYCQSVDFLRSNVIPPQFITNSRDPNQYIDVILKYQD